MPPEQPPPDFDSFARWVASRFGATDTGAVPPDRLVAAARDARDASGTSGPAMPGAPQPSGSPARVIEVLEFLAAASAEETARPPELVTGRGFRVALAYENTNHSQMPAICVLVQCPVKWAVCLEGETVFLWLGPERYELGQLDADGKAIGFLPAGIRVTMADFSSGVVRLETPAPPSSD